MNRLNWIFTLSSISVILVTIERFSFTGKILLQPFNFLRLHELIQITFLILLTVIIPVLLLREVTNNFKSFGKRDFWLLMLFVTGVYFYATGNGVHELASFLFNHYCDVKSFSGNLCNGFFFNDYYTGNIYYFMGGFAMVASLLLLELKKPNQNYSKKDFPLTLINAVIYAFAIFAYAAFDVVLIGLIYSLITTIFALGLFMKIKNKYLQYPLITYTTITYFLGTVAALIIRLLK